MSYSDLSVKDGGGSTVTVKALTSVGQAAESASAPVVLATEQEALVGALTETAPTNDTNSSGLNGRMQRIAQRITALIGLIPASLGQKAMAASLAVVVASDQSAIPITGQAGAFTARSAATQFGRPADTTQYAVGDLVANSTTAASVSPLTFAVNRSGTTGLGGMVRRARIKTSQATLTAASFRLHLYSATPGTPTNGDNGAWLTAGAATYLGSIDITIDKLFSDGAVGLGVPGAGSEVNYVTDNIYGLLEARDIYTPASAQTFDVSIEVLEN